MQYKWVIILAIIFLFPLISSDSVWIDDITEDKVVWDPEFVVEVQANISNISLNDLLDVDALANDEYFLFYNATSGQWNSQFINLSAIGGGGFWSQSGGNLYPTTITDKVGVGTAAPGADFEVNGTTILGDVFSDVVDIYGQTSFIGENNGGDLIQAIFRNTGTNLNTAISWQEQIGFGGTIGAIQVKSTMVDNTPGAETIKYEIWVENNGTAVPQMTIYGNKTLFGSDYTIPTMPNATVEINGSLYVTSDSDVCIDQGNCLSDLGAASPWTDNIAGGTLHPTNISRNVAIGMETSGGFAGPIQLSINGSVNSTTGAVIGAGMANEHPTEATASLAQSVGLGVFGGQTFGLLETYGQDVDLTARFGGNIPVQNHTAIIAFDTTGNSGIDFVPLGGTENSISFWPGGVRRAVVNGTGLYGLDHFMAEPSETTITDNNGDILFRAYDTNPVISGKGVLSLGPVQPVLGVDQDGDFITIVSDEAYAAAGSAPLGITGANRNNTSNPFAIRFMNDIGNNVRITTYPSAYVNSDVANMSSILTRQIAGGSADTTLVIGAGGDSAALLFQLGGSGSDPEPNRGLMGCHMPLTGLGLEEGCQLGTEDPWNVSENDGTLYISDDFGGGAQTLLVDSSGSKPAIRAIANSLGEDAIITNGSINMITDQQSMTAYNPGTSGTAGQIIQSFSFGCEGGVCDLGGGASYEATVNFSTNNTRFNFWLTNYTWSGVPGPLEDEVMVLDVVDNSLSHQSGGSLRIGDCFGAFRCGTPEATADIRGTLKVEDWINVTNDQWCNATECYEIADFLGSGGNSTTPWTISGSNIVQRDVTDNVRIGDTSLTVSDAVVPVGFKITADESSAGANLQNIANAITVDASSLGGFITQTGITLAPSSSVGQIYAEVMLKENATLNGNQMTFTTDLSTLDLYPGGTSSTFVLVTDSSQGDDGTYAYAALDSNTVMNVTYPDTTSPSFTNHVTEVWIINNDVTVHAPFTDNGLILRNSPNSGDEALQIRDYSDGTDSINIEKFDAGNAIRVDSTGVNSSSTLVGLYLSIINAGSGFTKAIQVDDGDVQFDDNLDVGGYIKSISGDINTSSGDICIEGGAGVCLSEAAKWVTAGAAPNEELRLAKNDWFLGVGGPAAVPFYRARFLERNQTSGILIDNQNPSTANSSAELHVAVFNEAHASIIAFGDLFNGTDIYGSDLSNMRKKSGLFSTQQMGGSSFANGQLVIANEYPFSPGGDVQVYTGGLSENELSLNIDTAGDINITRGDLYGQVATLSEYLHIKANTTSVGCFGSNAGVIYFDGELNKHRACNGTTWNELY